MEKTVGADYNPVAPVVNQATLRSLFSLAGKAIWRYYFDAYFLIYDNDIFIISVKSKDIDDFLFLMNLNFEFRANKSLFGLENYLGSRKTFWNYTD